MGEMTLILFPGKHESVENKASSILVLHRLWILSRKKYIFYASEVSWVHAIQKHPMKKKKISTKRRLLKKSKKSGNSSYRNRKLKTDGGKNLILSPEFKKSKEF